MGIKIYTIFFLVVASFLYQDRCQAYTFWKKCLVKDNSFYADIVDADNIELGNSEQRIIAGVKCTGTERRHSFSLDDDGVSLLADSSVTVADSTKICQGDPIYVQKDTCYILFVKEIE